MVLVVDAVVRHPRHCHHQSIIVTDADGADEGQALQFQTRATGRHIQTNKHRHRHPHILPHRQPHRQTNTSKHRRPDAKIQKNENLLSRGSARVNNVREILIFTITITITITMTTESIIIILGVVIDIFDTGCR